MILQDHKYRGLNMKPIKISVAMTSFNGEKYILKQLKSIVSQTIVPDEVIICDDQSTDNTVELVERFIKENNLEDWSIVRNVENLGWKRNFYKVASLTTGDIVFFSDQDDIWLPQKIETMTKIMVEKNAGCVFGKKTIIDSNDMPLLEREEQRSFTNEIKQVVFRKSFFTKKVLGCCMCISRKIADLYLSLNCPDAGHDSQCARLALLYDTLWELDEPVIEYRIHSNNSSGISADVSFGASTNSKRYSGIQVSIGWMIKLLDRDDLDLVKKEIIKNCIVVQNNRSEYFKSDSKRLFVTLVRFIPYYSGLTMFVGDFAYKHDINIKMGKLRWKLGKRV